MADYGYSDADDSTPIDDGRSDAAPRRDYDRPSRDDIMALREELKVRYSVLHTEMEQDQNWVYAASTHNSALLDKYIKGFPKDFTLKVLPIAALGVAVATDSVMTGESAAVAVALPDGLHRDEVAAQAHKDDLKDFCEAFLFQVDNGTAESPWRDFVKKGFTFGYGVISYTIRWDLIPQPPTHGRRTRKEKQAWAEYEHQRKYCFPFDVHSVHPMNIYPDPDNDPPEYYIEVTEVNLRSITRKHPHLLEKKPEWLQKLRPAGEETGTPGTVTRTTFVSRKYFAQYVDDVPLLVEGADEDGVAENPMGYLWYRQAYSGFGEQDDKGRLEYRVKGIVRDVRPVMASYITNYNVTEVMRQITAFPPLWFSHEQEDEAVRQSNEFTWGPAQKFISDERLQIKNIPTPQVPQVVFQNQELSNNILRLQFGPDILRGEARDETATGQQVRLRQAKMPYQTMKVATEQVMAGMLTDVLNTIRDDFDGPVTVWMKSDGQERAVTISPKRIPPVFQLTVTLSPPSQEERDQKLKELMTLAKEGWISTRRAMAESGKIENPDEEMIEIAAEKNMRLAPVEQWMAQVALENTQKRIAAEQGMMPPPAQNAPGMQPGMDGNQTLAPTAQDVTVGPNGFTLDGAQPAPYAVGTAEPIQPMQPIEPGPPPPVIRG